MVCQGTLHVKNGWRRKEATRYRILHCRDLLKNVGKEKWQCRGSDSCQNPQIKHAQRLCPALLVPHLGCPAAARHDAGNEHVGGEEGEDRRRDGRAQDQGEKKRRRLLGRWGRAAPGAGGEGGGGGGGDGGGEDGDEEDDERTAIAKI